MIAGQDGDLGSFCDGRGAALARSKGGGPDCSGTWLSMLVTLFVVSETNK